MQGTFADRLRARRLELRLSQHDLAVLVGAGQTRISLLERGVQLRNLAELELLAGALGVSTSALSGQPASEVHA